MQWTSIFLFLIMYAILSPTLSTSTREKRSLSHIKRFLLSNIFGSSRGKHAETSLRHRTLKNSEFLVVPERQNFIIEAVPRSSNFRKTEQRRKNYNRFLSSPLRQFFDSEIFQEASKALRGLISSLQSGMVIAEETNSLIDDISQQVEEYASGDSLIINQNSVSGSEVLKTPIFNYGGQRILSNPQSMLGFWGPIDSMPRKYTYEQIKDGTVEKFSLDKNSDVIVTHTRGPMFPRPACIDDRIKEVIQTVPSLAYPTELVYTNINDRVHKSPAFVSIPNGNKLDGNGIFFNSINGNGFLSSTENIQKTLLQNSVLKYNGNGAEVKSPLTNTESKFTRSRQASNKPVQNAMINLKVPYVSGNIDATNEKREQHNDQLWNLRRLTNTSHFGIQDQSDIKQLNIPDKKVVDDANLQTRYAYKQETNDRVFKYSDTSNVSIVQDGKNFVLKMIPTNTTSLYAGNPIVVAPINDTSDVNINTLSMSPEDNEVSKNLSPNVKEKHRGDIPEYWYSHY